ncbi:MAG: hypothetical protein WBF43_00955, partial [Methylocella sp.]
SSAPLRLVAGAFCVIVTVALAAVVLLMPDPAPTLAHDSAQNLAETGLGNPITAVLIAYRSFDTLLEKVVLVLAVVGVWSLAPDRYWGVPLEYCARRGRKARWFSSRNCCRRLESSLAFTSSGRARTSRAAPFRAAPFSPPCG